MPGMKSEGTNWTSPFSPSATAKLHEIAEATGRDDIFMYSTHPTKTTSKYVFQSWVSRAPGVKEVCLSLAECEQNIETLWAWVQNHADEIDEWT